MSIYHIFLAIKGPVIILRAMEVVIRRQPQQKRSAERRLRILKAARQLLRSRGVEDLKMGELADKADVQIGSLYQYYSNKAALLKDLSMEYFRQGEELLARALTDLKTEAQIVSALEQVFDDYYELHKEDRAWAEVFRGVMADRKLQKMNFEDSVKNAKILSAYLDASGVAGSRSELASLTLLMIHLTVEVIQLSLFLGPRRGAEITRVFKQVFSKALAAQFKTY